MNLNKLDTKCKCCGEYNDDLLKHIIDHHLLSPWTYRTLEETGRPCVDCGKIRYSISPYLNNFYLPCRSCNSEKTCNKYILTKISELEDLVSSDKVIESLICSMETLEKSNSYNLSETRETILESYGKKKILKDNYLCIGFKLGYPKEISKRNLEGFGIKELSVPVSKLSFTISNTKYRILLPEKCGYDLRHHARCSILNNNSTRFTKKIKLDNGSCFKFWNNKKYPEIKSIFKILKNESEVDIDTIPKLDLYIIKQIILRNKTTSEILWNIYNEVFKYTKTLKDQVLLNNTIDIFQNNKIQVNIIWTPDKYIENYINISII